MTPLAIVLLGVGGVLTVLVLTITIIAATDQARATTARFLDARDRVQPELARLRENIAAVQERTKDLRTDSAD